MQKILFAVLFSAPLMFLSNAAHASWVPQAILVIFSATDTTYATEAPTVAKHMPTIESCHKAKAQLDAGASAIASKNLPKNGKVIVSSMCLDLK